MTFNHSGDLGDIVYSLPAVRAAGGGDYRLFPRNGRREIMTQARADLILPLLRAQPYITSAEFVQEATPGQLDNFRMLLLYRTLVDAHLKSLDFPLIENRRPWLTVNPRKSPNRVLIARSPRYRNPAFPWHDVYDKYADDAAFVGLPEDHEAFCREVGPIPYLPTADLLELAEYIAGSELFIGNQSCPMAIAHGLHSPAIMEVATDGCSDNCQLQRPNVTYGMNGTIDLPELGARHRQVLVCIPMKPTLNAQLKAKCLAAARAMADADDHVTIWVDTAPVEALASDYTPWSRVTRARNRLLGRVDLNAWSHILWIDADVVDYPVDMARRLIAANPDGVSAPMVLIEGGERFYDFAAFIERGHDHIEPRNRERIHPRNLRHEPPYWTVQPTTNVVDMDCVGTITMVPTSVYLDGARYEDHPAFTDHYPICKAARDAGRRVVVVRDVIAHHADLPKYAGEAWH